MKEVSFQLTSTRLRHTKYMYTATGEATLAGSWKNVKEKFYLGHSAECAYRSPY